jgi:hypothetical protein
MAKTVVKYRVSYSAVLFFLLALTGMSLSTLFAFTGLFEFLMILSLSYQMYYSIIIMPNTVFGKLIIQYADGNIADPIEMIHIGGARILACALGLFAAWWYIPTILIYLSTCVDIKAKGRR